MTVQALTCPKCGGNIKPSDRQCPFCGASLAVTMPAGQAGALLPQQLGWVTIGDQIRVNSARGQETVQVTGQVIFEELWQQQRGGPWVPTGGAFAGFWLETDCLLLSWQDRCYLLDQNQSTSDVNIARDFAPYARQFGQSDQKAQVDFDYNGVRWRMADIGRFRVNAVTGNGIRTPAKAEGRFIHAHGQDSRALVVEDYENTGGAQDMVWQGYIIPLSDVQKG